MKFKKLSRIYMIQLKAGEDEDNGGLVQMFQSLTHDWLEASHIE